MPGDVRAVLREAICRWEYDGRRTGGTGDWDGMASLADEYGGPLPVAIVSGCRQRADELLDGPLALFLALVEAAVEWRTHPGLNEYGSTAPWVGALLRMERAIDAVIAAAEVPDASSKALNQDLQPEVPDAG